MRAQEERHSILIVTGPARDRLYERFAALYRYRSDVLVIKDRRLGERRGCCTVFADDRRQAERRRCSSGWVFPPSSDSD